MEKLGQVWVVCADSAAAELTSGARELGESVTLVYAGRKNGAVNADKAFYLGPLGGEESFVNYAATAAELVGESMPELVLLDCGRDGRLVAACIAVRCGVSVQTDAGSLSLGPKGVETSRMVYGGMALKTERGGKTAVVCVGAGVFTAGKAEPCASVTELERPQGRVRLVEKREKAGSSVNLTAARRIVGIGRGLADEQDVESCRELADMIGAELGCTRPICEERHWMPHECYIGVSGLMVKPELYFAVGISGQVQHVVGVSSSGTIIAIDKDEAAPIFKACDYGIVGDLHKILPTLKRLIAGK